MVAPLVLPTFFKKFCCILVCLSSHENPTIVVLVCSSYKCIVLLIKSSVVNLMI